MCATFVVALFEVRRFCDRHRLLNACTGSPGPDLRHAGPVVQVRIVESVVPAVNVDLPADIDLGISTALDPKLSATTVEHSAASPSPRLEPVFVFVDRVKAEQLINASLPDCSSRRRAWRPLPLGLIDDRLHHACAYALLLE